MKKRLAILMAMVMGVSVIAMGCGGSDDAAKGNSSAETKKEETVAESIGKAKGDTFTVGFDANFPPYGYSDDSGEYVGFDLDLAQEVCDRNGWKLVKQPIDWDSKDMELESGTIDCIWNGFTMNGREDNYTWSEPYVDNSQVIVVAEDAGITTLEELAGKVVLVQADSSALATLQDEEGQAELAGTFGELTEIADYNTAFMNLEAGAADAVAMDIGVANYQIESRGGGFVILDEQLSTEQYAVGFKLNNGALRDQVQKTLDEMTADGTLEKIAENYADFGVPDALCVTE